MQRGPKQGQYDYLRTWNDKVLHETREAEAAKNEVYRERMAKRRALIAAIDAEIKRRMGE